MLQRGVKPAEWRRLEVSRTPAFRRQQALAVNGCQALRKAPRTGRLPETEKRRLVEALEAGASAQGYAADLWTLERADQMEYLFDKDAAQNQSVGDVRIEKVEQLFWDMR